jgi:hypothetical protein
MPLRIPPLGRSLPAEAKPASTGGKARGTGANPSRAPQLSAPLERLAATARQRIPPPRPVRNPVAPHALNLVRGSSTSPQRDALRNRYFIAQRACSPEKIEALREKFGPAFEALTFQAPGLCHTHVEYVAQVLAGQRAMQDKPSAALRNPLLGEMSNFFAGIRSALNNKPLELADVLSQGIPRDVAVVVIHAVAGAADADSAMVGACEQMWRAGAPISAGANHSVAILEVDTEDGIVHLYDPDYARESASSGRMRAYCREHGIEPGQLSHETIARHGWLGELVRSVSAEELQRKCLPRLVGVVGILRKAD